MVCGSGDHPEAHHTFACTHCTGRHFAHTCPHAPHTHTAPPRPPTPLPPTPLPHPTPPPSPTRHTLGRVVWPCATPHFTHALHSCLTTATARTTPTLPQPLHAGTPPPAPAALPTPATTPAACHHLALHWRTTPACLHPTPHPPPPATTALPCYLCPHHLPCTLYSGHGDV